MRLLATFNPENIQDNEKTAMHDLHFLAYKFLAEEMSMDCLNIENLFDISNALSENNSKNNTKDISSIIGSVDFVLHSAKLHEYIIEDNLLSCIDDITRSITEIKSELISNLVSKRMNDFLFELYKKNIQYAAVPDHMFNIHQKDHAIVMARERQIKVPLTTSVLAYHKKDGKVVIKSVSGSNSKNILIMLASTYQKIKKEKLIIRDLSLGNNIAQEYIDSPTVKVLSYGNIILGGEVIIKKENEKNIYHGLSGSGTLHDITFNKEKFNFLDKNYRNRNTKEKSKIEESLDVMGIKDSKLPSLLEDYARTLSGISATQGNRLCSSDFMYNKGEWNFIGDVNPLPRITIFRTMYLDEKNKQSHHTRRECAMIYAKIMQHCLEKEFKI